MINLNKKFIVASSTILIVLGLAGANTVFAATSPSLGTAASYGLLADTFNYNIGLTSIIGTAGQAVLGYVGAFPGGGATLAITGDTEVNNAARTQAGIDQNNALNNVVDGLNIQACTSIGVIVDLAGYDMDGAGPLPPGTFTPGCYSSTGAMNVDGGATVTLDGAGTYIFRPNGTLNTSANSIVQTANGASECDIFWAPTAATTLGADSTLVGSVLDAAGITIGNNVTWVGRALAYGGTVTADSDTITVPVCAASPATISVVKTVINDNGRSKVIADFPLFINGATVVSSAVNVFAAPGTYTVTETSDSDYTRTFSGDCDASGLVNIIPGSNKICIITNNDIAPSSGGGIGIVTVIPPLIDVVKVPNPLALPAGPGPVTYTYTLRNTGTVPVTDVTMVGDSCEPITFISGDTNTDDKLDLNETWVYTCDTTLSETHTNTITAVGWGNGISATDIASSTVIVGSPTVPPLIHVTKTPDVFTLPAGGGMVTYTEKITNPGTVALNNVNLNDDKCSPMEFISGDTNSDSKLDTTETWTYTCSTNLTQTTLNTAVATGDANGITVRDFAIATVTVATPPATATPVATPVVTPTIVPGLPNTGFSPSDNSFLLSIISAVIFAASFLLYVSKKN